MMRAFEGRPTGLAARTALALLAVIAALGPGCGRRSESASESEAGAVTAGSQAPGERRFPLTGEVIAADSERRLVRVRHDEVAGFMPAMTMEFAVGEGDAASLRSGERIRAELVVPPTGKPRLERIWPDDRVPLQTVEAGALSLREDTHDRGSAVFRDLGEAIPNFALFDQDGRVVQSGRFRGRQIVLNFIYSRCPIATMCPASTLKMSRTQRLARESGVTDVEFVSFTLDPSYDTPGVLKAYVLARGLDTGNWSFLTGPEPAVRDLLAQFGVLAEFKDGILKHTLATLLIDRTGRIVYRADGSDWDPKDIVEQMAKGGRP